MGFLGTRERAHCSRVQLIIGLQEQSQSRAQCGARWRLREGPETFKWLRSLRQLEMGVRAINLSLVVGAPLLGEGQAETQVFRSAIFALLSGSALTLNGHGYSLPVGAYHSRGAPTRGPMMRGSRAATVGGESDHHHHHSSCERACQSVCIYAPSPAIAAAGPESSAQG